MIYAHRLAWELVHGPIPEGMCVLHHCDNPACVRPSHLFLGTQKENVQDMYAKGRQPDLRGERNPKCKLIDQDVHDIRRGEMLGATQTELAELYGITQGYVSKILRGENRAG